MSLEWSQRPEKETRRTSDETMTQDYSDQCYWDQQEYLEESWRPEETCCHSDFSKKNLSWEKITSIYINIYIYI